MDEEYEDLKEDIQEECSKFGVILSMKIPRPMMSLMVPGLGKVYIEYTSIDEAKEAKKANILFRLCRDDCLITRLWSVPIMMRINITKTILIDYIC